MSGENRQLTTREMFAKWLVAMSEVLAGETQHDLSALLGNVVRTYGANGELVKVEMDGATFEGLMGYMDHLLERHSAAQAYLSGELAQLRSTEGVDRAKSA